MNKFLEGNQIYLRTLTKADIPLWFDWFNNSLITEHMNKGIFPNTEEAQEEYFNYLAKSENDIQSGIVLKEKDSLIGVVGIHNIRWVHKHGDVSIVIGDLNSWGKGIAFEALSLIVEHAFSKMNLHKLTAGMWSSNAGSRKVFEKIGFIREGILKEQRFFRGKYVDEFRFGLLRNDWEKLQREK